MGNFLLPLMIGARDVAFPRLNLLSWYLYIVAAAFTVYVIVAGGVDTGWTFYTPFSTMFSNGHVVAGGARRVRRPAFPRSRPASISSPRCTCCARRG